jgi:hypothetical protein
MLRTLPAELTASPAPPTGHATHASIELTLAIAAAALAVELCAQCAEPQHQGLCQADYCRRLLPQARRAPIARNAMSGRDDEAWKAARDSHRAKDTDTRAAERRNERKQAKARKRLAGAVVGDVPFSRNRHRVAA